MSASDPLDRLLAEVRAQHPPEPREAALPARLHAEFRSFAAQPESGERPRERAAAWPWGLAAVLAAAGTLLVLGDVLPPGDALSLSDGRPQRTEQPSAVVSASVDGQPLAVGAPFEATATRRLVQHPGRAVWLLEPGSRARLLSDGPVLRVELEQGRLTAHVQPSAQPESFVVQARGTEVAVHGTSFSVALSGERAHVEVSHGRVLVRPQGHQDGTVLDAHMQSDFSAGAVQPLPLPGEPPVLPAMGEAKDAPAGTSVEEGSSRSASEPRVAAHRPEPPGPPPARQPASAVHPPAPPPVPDAESERALKLVTEHVQSCFRRQLIGSKDLGVEVSTRLGLWVEPSGQLLRADFEPPLAPAIEACVAAQLAQFRAAPSAEGYRVERDLLLHR